MRLSALILCAITASAALAAQESTPRLAPPPPGFGPRMDIPSAKKEAEKKPAEKKPADKKPAKEKAKTPAPAPKSEERPTTGRAQRSAVAPAPVPAPKPGPYGPGQDVGDGFRACVPGDTIAAGTVKQGYRKIEANTPFGRSCRWEKADAAAEAPAPAPTAMASNGPLPGVDVGGGYRGCASTESAASGTVQNGYRKVIAQTPFGQTCRWEPVQEGQATADYRPCAAGDGSPAGTVKDGFRKVEAVTPAGKTCRWERTAAAQ